MSENFEIAWDSTRLGLLKTCPRKYQLKMLQHWRPKGESVHLDFGQYYHAALEDFDKAIAQGQSYEAATIVAVRRALVDSKTFVGNDYKNRQTLVRAIVWYLENFREDTIETVILANGKPAVELSFRMEIPLETPTGENYILCGHIDRLVKYGDVVYVLDRKTTKSSLGTYYYNQFDPSNQMTLYTLATQVILPEPAVGVIIDACQLAIGFARFGRTMIYKTQEKLLEWLEDTKRWIKTAERYSLENHWPMNDTACTMYGGCEFVEVCKAGCGTAQMLLATNFEQKEWNPMEVRGE